MSIKGKAVIECYENYREEDRLTTNQARKIEFITTVRVLQDIMPASGKILDCAAGTGVYAFHFADKIDKWPKEKFDLWCDHHYKICSQKSLLGMSNHVIIAGKKC